MSPITNEEKSIIRHLKDYWMIYVFIASMIINYATTSSRLFTLEAKAQKNDQLHESMDINILQIKTDIASINTSLKYLVPNNQK